MPTNRVTLAAPGTGKTTKLIRKVRHLIAEAGIQPREILVVTFTRAAAREVKEKMLETPEIDPSQLPDVMTLHAFSLKLLVSDTYRSRLTMPLRVIDKWENSSFLVPALAARNGFVGRDRAKVIAKKLRVYEAGWNELSFDQESWIESRDPQFYHSLRRLQSVFGFTLLGELPFLARGFLRSTPSAVSGHQYKYVLVDEYQDLNPCDQDIVRLISAQSEELHVFGDDDQSIYGFRQAAPRGILDFINEFPNVVNEPLEICYRCPQPILSFAQRVIEMTDVRRAPKSVRSQRSTPSFLSCLSFQDSGEEIAGVMRIIDWLHTEQSVSWRDILILVPSRRFGGYIVQALNRETIPIENYLADNDPLAIEELRKIYACLRLLGDRKDCLALWTWLRLSDNVGAGTLEAIVRLCEAQSIDFVDAVQQIRAGASTLGDLQVKKVRQAAHSLDLLMVDLQQKSAQVPDMLISLASRHERPDSAPQLRQFVTLLDDLKGEDFSINELVSQLQTAEFTPSIAPTDDRIRVMTMHQAKGLSARSVIIPFLEDPIVLQYANTDAEKEEKRRLLYVSLTRSREYLFLTYCERRRDSSAYTATGRRRNRRLLCFLDEANLQAFDGSQWLHKQDTTPPCIA